MPVASVVVAKDCLDLLGADPDCHEMYHLQLLQLHLRMQWATTSSQSRGDDNAAMFFVVQALDRIAMRSQDRLYSI